MTVRIYCFNDFRLVINDASVNHWKAGKACELFQLLLLNRGKVLTRDILNDALWPNRSTSNRSTSLKVAVHTLRRILERANDGDEREPALRLSTRDSGYRLDVQGTWIDTEAFKSSIVRAHLEHNRGNLDQELAEYRYALDLYCGDYLPCLTSDWACIEREWLRGQALLALRRLAHAGLDAGDDYSVVDACRRILAIEPYCEEAYRLLIVVHGRLGQLVQARRWYQLCSDLLFQGLQVTPDRSTTDLFSKAMRGHLLSEAVGGTRPSRLSQCALDVRS